MIKINHNFVKSPEYFSNLILTSLFRKAACQ